MQKKKRMRRRTSRRKNRIVILTIMRKASSLHIFFKHTFSQFLKVKTPQYLRKSPKTQLCKTEPQGEKKTRNHKYDNEQTRYDLSYFLQYICRHFIAQDLNIQTKPRKEMQNGCTEDQRRKHEVR